MGIIKQPSNPPSPSLAVHAANRLMFGPRPGDVERIDSMGYDAFLQEQLQPMSIDDSEADMLLNQLPHVTLEEDWTQLYDRRKAKPYEEVTRPIYEVRHATWTRIVNSKRQLYERMINFWYDHFNIYGWDYMTRSVFPDWDRMIRTHAMGNFHEFLVATAQHPSMLRYLDNYRSTDGGPNENYARELIELHTMGAMNYNKFGGYYDDDVYEASRCLTGWSYNRDEESPERGKFQYNHGDHDRFQKVFLGESIGRDQPPLYDGLIVLEKLANHPGTAQHIAWKLCVKFISDNPPQSIVDSTANVFHQTRKSSDQIRQTLGHLLSSDEFKQARMNKFKRPVDWMASMMRTLNLPYFVHDNYRFEWLYDSMGQAMFAWRPPDGAPDVASFWATSNNLMQRWRLAFRISAGSYEKYGFALNAQTQTPPELTTPEELSEFWIQCVFGRPISEETRYAIIDFIAEGRNPKLSLHEDQIASKLGHLAALCITTPEFMRK